MKKLLSVLFLCAMLFVGCQKTSPVPPPQPNPVPVNPTPVPVPQTITESNNGQTFSVTKGSVLTFGLKVDVSSDFFWAFTELDGDFEVLADTRRGTVQTLTVKVGSSGNIKLQYCNFSPDGVRVLSYLAFGVKAN